jgi:hypothetical protein
MKTRNPLQPRVFSFAMLNQNSCLVTLFDVKFRDSVIGLDSALDLVVRSFRARAVTLTRMVETLRAAALPRQYRVLSPMLVLNLILHYKEVELLRLPGSSG